jgi:hypothetical protein
VIDAAHVQKVMRCTLAAGATAMLMAAPLAAGQAPSRQRVNTHAADLQEFQQRLDAYLQLRATLLRGMAPLTETPNAAELAARQRALAAALKKARAGAKPGDLIPAGVAAQIAEIIRDDFARRTAADERATFSEVPHAPRPATNQTYPAAAALPTVPPLLLHNLPRLPDNLQYRFYGRHVLILDGDAQIVLDYIANVLPPH